MWDTYILNPMINGLLFMYQLLGGNFGLAIIGLTILIRLVTFPLMYQSQKSARAMQDMQRSKEWLDIQKKYAGNKEKIQMEQMKLMQSVGVNPLGGCLPTVIQFPILIGLYQSITSALPTTPLQLFGMAHRIYSFIPNAAQLIPVEKQFLWMNLAKTEGLIVPFLPFAIPVLAILVAITSWVSQRMVPMAASDPQTAQTTNMMNVMMVIIITNLSLTLPSGLSVYYVMSNVLTMVQFMLMGRVDWRRVIGFGSTPAPAK